MDRYERLERIDYKSARDVVTEADHLSEALILDAIRARYPADAILAEETGEHRAIAGEAPTSGRGRVWIVDPLDGTVNYANGIPVFCVSIGLVVDGRPAVGVILDPTRDEIVRRDRRRPRDAQRAPDPRLRQGKAVRLRDLDVAQRPDAASRRPRSVRKAIRISRTMGSAALALAYVANGRFDAFIQQGGLSAWDVAAAGLIAERGGAIVTSMDGGPWFDLARGPKSIGILAAPRPHHHGAASACRSASPRASGAAVPASRSRPHSSQNASQLGPRRAVPAQLLGVALADDDAIVRGPQARQIAVQQRIGPLFAQRRGQRDRPRPAEPRHLPGRRLGRDLLEVAVLGEHGRGRLAAPARQPREAVGTVADEPEIVRDRGRRHAPFLADPGVVVDQVAPAIPQDDAVVADQLGHVLVGRADEDPLDPGSSAKRMAAAAIASSASNSTIGHSTIPSASTAASAIGNWASSSGGIPADDL